jgi:hypothetical protein
MQLQAHTQSCRPPACDNIQSRYQQFATETFSSKEHTVTCSCLRVIIMTASAAGASGRPYHNGPAVDRLCLFHSQGKSLGGYICIPPTNQPMHPHLLLCQLLCQLC